MNYIELIYQDESIEIYVKSNLINQEYYLCDNAKVLARYYVDNMIHMHILVKMVKFEHLEKFDKFVKYHLTKDL